jgi:tRNA-specific 2-thiouridylase
LCQLDQSQLSSALFPIGNLLKPEVREIAKEMGLVTAEKKDSQGLCFVGKISLPTFLQQKLKAVKGDVIEIPQDLEQFESYNSIDRTPENLEELCKPFVYDRNMGKKVAEHQGAHFYTIGQRKGLHIGGRPEPSFVIGIDTDENLVFSGQTDEHPGLNRWALKIDLKDVHWVNPKYYLKDGEELRCDVRIRYRQKLRTATLFQKNSGLYILFEEKQKGITPGQFAAWYLGEELIGSGVIAS